MGSPPVPEWQTGRVISTWLGRYSRERGAEQEEQSKYIIPTVTFYARCTVDWVICSITSHIKPKEMEAQVVASLAGERNCSTRMFRLVNCMIFHYLSNRRLNLD